jgi:hypothetical protein|tara:strand:+ start:3805 stop:4101 length:297 start_codon:yes stop_codon:yes gene_type:complete
MTEGITITTLVFLSIWCMITTYYCVKFAKSLLVITESIEGALDILDDKYNSISKVLEIPIFYDSTEVRQVLEDINKSRDAVLQVASLLGQVEEVNDGV